MKRLRYTAKALQDFQEIHDYIAQDNIDAAADFIERLNDRCHELCNMPGIGRKRDDLAPGMRSSAVGEHLIFYHVLNGELEVVHVAMTEDFRHQLWLIYEQLKDAESDEDKRLELLTRSREELGQVINQLHRQAEPGLYALLASVGAKGGRPASTYFCRDCAPASDDPDNERLIDCSGSPYAKKKECSECGGTVTYRLE